MIIRILTMLAAGVSLMAVDADFNGRWNIQVENPRGRAWWLVVEGAGAGNITGEFVGVPGGQVDRLEQARVTNGELEFVFERKRQDGVLRQVYRARLVGGELHGTRVEIVNGQEGPPLPWRGIRGPVIKDRDDGSWRPGRPVVLFNGADTAAWRLAVEGRPGWRMKGDSMVNDQGATDLVSRSRFWNFELRAEYRYSKGSNSGIGLRGRYEIQIYDDHGQPPSDHGHGALYSRVAPAVNASNPPGEWQNIVIRLVGHDLTVTLNGKKLHDKLRIAGPTAMMIHPFEDQPGPIVLQGDHGPIEFKSIVVTPLQKR
jgi:hypothetical protein